MAWSSRRQRCIATSTYCAEFIAIYTAVEVAISLRCMLLYLGIHVMKGDPTTLYGDNWGVIQSASIPDSELKRNTLLFLITT